jgi:ribonucleoside-diphosphate reductase alpha chain
MNGESKDAALGVASGVIEILEMEKEQEEGTEFIPNVEHIQDLVELQLMEQGYPVTAKAYILYRQKKAEERVVEQEQIAEKVEESLETGKDVGIMITLRDGTRAPFKASEIEDYLTKSAQGFDSVSVEHLMNLLKHNIFDDISVAEINQALVMVAKSCLEKDPQYGKLAARILINEMNKQVVGENEFDLNFAELYKTKFVEKINEGVEGKRYDERMNKLFDLNKLAAVLDPSRDREFEYRGIQVLWDRYAIRDSEQKLLETPQYFWMRIAMGMALIEKDPTASALEFYELISTMCYLPGSPSLIHSGQPRAQMSSCYLNTVEDDLGNWN